MIIAWNVSLHDNDTYMLGETFRPENPGPYYHWRFGKDGVPHPATCPTCGRKTNPNYINPDFRLKRRKWDAGVTYDGYTIVSERFKALCEDRHWSGISFTPLPAEPGFFVLTLTELLHFDAARRGTRFENWCPTCKAYFSVVGATPVFLKDVQEPILEGFYRSDLEFASGHEQHPLMIVGNETAQVLKAAKLSKLDFLAIKA